MARLARVEVFAADEIAVVHVMARTVRRCFLLGEDAVTGKNYDHRKLWLDEQLIHQAKYFGIDLLCQAILSNHIHLVVRFRPDVVAEWNDSEVARRWLMLCPVRRDKNRQAMEPTEFELNHICNDKEKVAAVRNRLSDISWWMRLLSQNIAQRANKEDQEVGKFWQARYRAVRLLDETAILACAAYVDLNPIRAAIAATIEDSDFTSGQKRALQLRGEFSVGGVQRSVKPEVKGDAAIESDERGSKAPSSGLSAIFSPEAGEKGRVEGTERHVTMTARHLSPVELSGQRGKTIGGGTGVSETGETGLCTHADGQRCSDKGFLPMSLADYLNLLDWTAREVRSDKQGATPQHLAAIFDRLGLSSEVWCHLVKNFGKLFSVVAGQPHQIDGHRSKSNTHRYRARRAARDLLSSVQV